MRKCIKRLERKIVELQRNKEGKSSVGNSK